MDQQQINTTEENYLFNIDVKKLYNITQHLSHLESEVIFNISNSEITSLFMDPAVVSLIDLKLKESFFNQINKDLNTKFKINVDSLLKILKENKKFDVSFYLKDLNLILKFSNGLISKLNLLDIDTAEEKNIPIMDFENKIKIDSKILSDVIKPLSKISDSVSFELIKTADNKQQFSLRSKNALNEESSINFKEESYNILKTNYLDSKSKYSLEYLEKFIKPLLTEHIVLSFNQDFPLKFEYNTADFEIKYILAPRIEAED